MASAAAAQLTPADEAAAEEFVNQLARDEVPGSRLPLLLELLEADGAPPSLQVSCAPLLH